MRGELGKGEGGRTGGEARGAVDAIQVLMNNGHGAEVMVVTSVGTHRVAFAVRVFLVLGKRIVWRQIILLESRSTSNLCCSKRAIQR
jgi:hypothetical protein